MYLTVGYNVQFLAVRVTESDKQRSQYKISRFGRVTLGKKLSLDFSVFIGKCKYQKYLFQMS